MKNDRLCSVAWRTCYRYSLILRSFAAGKPLFAQAKPLFAATKSSFAGSKRNAYSRRGGYKALFGRKIVDVARNILVSIYTFQTFDWSASYFRIQSL